MKLGEQSLLALTFLLLVTVGASHVCDGIPGTYEDWSSQATRHDVIVIGGGISGLEATKTLIANGINNVLLLEAQDYLGGRVKTYREGKILVEDGAEWVQGGPENPLYKLADETLGSLTQPLRANSFDARIKTQDGQDGDIKGYWAAKNIIEECEKENVLSKYNGIGIGQCHSAEFPKFYDGKPSEQDAWLYYLKMLLLKDAGTFDWTDQSVPDVNNFLVKYGKDWNQWKSGYDALINYTKKSIPDSKIQLSSPVCKIFWKSNSNSGREAVVVTSAEKAYKADYVLVTVSIGHLKERHTQLFSPALPQYYTENFDGIKLGLADKVQIGWDTPWWGSKPLELNVLFTRKFSSTQDESWLNGIMEFMSIHQQLPILQGFVTGNHALKMESLPEETVKQHLVAHLQKLTNMNVPQPTFFRRSKWNDNIWMRGSYNSFITVDGDRFGLKTREPFLEPIYNDFGDQVISWAGEHTDTYRYGTVDGAMESGRKAAIEILYFYDTRA